MSADRQLDLFAATGFRPDPLAPNPVQRPRLSAESLADDVLIATIPNADVDDSQALAGEAGRRLLIAAAPALEALCRRFKGFGLHHPVPEQTAALQALAAIRGPAAAAAVTRIIVELVAQGPGLRTAIAAAADLRCRLPAGTAAALLSIRTPVCGPTPPAARRREQKFLLCWSTYWGISTAPWQRPRPARSAAWVGPKPARCSSACSARILPTTSSTRLPRSLTRRASSCSDGSPGAFRTWLTTPSRP